MTSRQGATLAWPISSLLLFGLLAAAVVAGVADHFDLAVRDGVHQLAQPALTAFLSAMTHLGSVVVLVVLFLICYIAFRAMGWRAGAARLVWTMGGAVVLENGLKFLFQRARPEPFFGLVAPETYSFPSGHALYSTCFYGVAAWTFAAYAVTPSSRIAIWASSAAIVAIIGFSRIYLGVHYPTDVLGGLLAAAAWMSIIRLWEEAAYRATPRDPPPPNRVAGSPTRLRARGPNRRRR
jgi:undecaprenyl-diphosphatase